MKINKYIFFAMMLFMGIVSCKKVSNKFDGLLNNPNAPTQDAANADLYLNQAGVSMVQLFDDMSSFGMSLTRQFVFYGPDYRNGYNPNNFDGVWSTAYTGVIKHVDALIPIASAQQKWVNVAIAKVYKAYTFMTLVDMFGDVPYSEANLGVNNTNPKVESGQQVYTKCIALLDEAIADIAKPSSAYPGALDLFYKASDATTKLKWATLAKTLKIRAYMQIRLVDPSVKAKIAAIVAAGDYIKSPADEFEFKFSSRQANPDSRHPRFVSNYQSASSPGDYIGTYFLHTLVVDKGTNANNDPRTRYYFYRQVTGYGSVNNNNSSCSFQSVPSHYPAGMPFCLSTLVGGYWGRDHGDNSGIPPDGPLRTTVGIYPFGGEFDASQAAALGNANAPGRGAKGAGIEPMWLSSYTNFLLAEYELTLNNDPVAARALLNTAVSESITKVMGYPATVGVTPNPSFVPAATQVTGYLNKVLARYDAAVAPNDKLGVIGKEFYIALYGNGVDAYNLYRRTGKPSDVQFTIDANPGNMIRSFYYPSVFVNRNVNATQKAGSDVRVFWDNNPLNFIK